MLWRFKDTKDWRVACVDKSQVRVAVQFIRVRGVLLSDGGYEAYGWPRLCCIDTGRLRAMMLSRL